MVKYQIEALKVDKRDCAILKSTVLLSCDNKTRALLIARSVSDGVRPRGLNLNEYTHILVNELKYNKLGELLNSKQIASFEVK